MNEIKVTKIIFKGTVQGVGFRPTIYRVAKQMGTNGYVQNKGSEVEVIIDTDPKDFIQHVKDQLPTLASIESIETYPSTKKVKKFKIIPSANGSHQSLIPKDTAICNDCLNELFDNNNRRFEYPFINCTVCGARYSLITNVPYDRNQTAMKPFHLCNECDNDYKDASNRRFHAQTISCSTCGPKYNLYNDKQNKINTKNPIETFSQYIDDGSIGVIKSWGGMHLCCRLEEIERFREWYQRPQKAFAIMIRSIKDAEQYATISENEKKILISEARPIVLVKKTNHNLISPGLDSIGLFLPYTAVHHLLFSNLKANAVIMTSANIPGEPMIVENDDSFSLHADYYLLHNRQIPNRIDDTVLKIWNDKNFFIRKSRGYVLDPIEITYSSQILSVGAGQNVYGGLSSNKKLFLTPYLGNDTSYETLLFLKKTLNHYIDLLIDDHNIDAVIRDMHPAYETRKTASYFSDSFDTPLFDVQHHWAHAVSLLVDNNVKEGIVLTLDGLGYGDDGTFWGSEVLFSDEHSYKREGHLKPIRLLGGDKATEDPRRLIYSIFKTFGEEYYFKDTQASIFNKMLKTAPLSSSFGRILDALSCYLGICCKRTYDGEPAMKLERYLSKGSPSYSFDLSISNGVIDSIDLFKQLHEFDIFPLSESKRPDIAYSFVKTLIKGMSHIAIKAAEKHQVQHIGLTGGVSYNIPITEMIFEEIKKTGFSFLVHNRIPNGDGGISIGQNVIGSHLL
ncbi:MAG: carbamoyltransferase HypF [Thermoplasmata archaeon]|nr:MAG: carbamoyltransferase HypF [Thermoplasmata archaeon]